MVKKMSENGQEFVCSSGNERNDSPTPDSDSSVVLIEQNIRDVPVATPNTTITKVISSSNSSVISVDNNRLCWICLMSDEDEIVEKSTAPTQTTAEWVHPCHCSGTSKWVHQTCLQLWIDEKQKFNSRLKVTCSQCDYEYVLLYPTDSILFSLLEFCDRTLYSVSPLIAVTCIFGSIYWSAVCYGAFTILQVMGKDAGRNMIEQSDPVALLIGLPSIPVVLIIAKFIRWEEHILKLWLANEFRLPFLGYSVLGKPKEKPQEFTEQNLLRRDDVREPISMCRAFCGALVLPTCATIFGGFLYPSVTSNLHRAILGGVTFILGKGFLKIILRQHQYIRQTHRRIVNFKEETSTTTTTTISSNNANSAPSGATFTLTATVTRQA